MSQSTLDDLPDAVRLEREYDVPRLVADLKQITGHQWQRQRYFSDTGVGTEVSYDWTVLPLRSPGGGDDRTDPGGPGLVDHADTGWLARTPYFARILAELPVPLRAVRLMALGPGAATRKHVDTKYGFPWGTLRLHIPITTVPEATLEFGDDVYRWQPGTLWFGNFCRPHRVSNTGTGNRVHMVIDTHVTPELVELFPAELREALAEPDVVFARPEQPLDPGGASRRRCRFAMPKPFTSWEDDDEFRTSDALVDASIDWAQGQLAVHLDGSPALGLVHLGEGEFRFRGWTDERWIRVEGQGDGMTVTLFNRRGSEVRSRNCPAAAL
ncbi:aspartyl/asparaginyl beta-hydroxylase domain-containing protein [Streptomonospora alba]|uniref:aspartyl/asparaginyl beta-hydroxylase domain-containing protein n=1 Tax=Streptomonospora alba TaxID=183763 RepID=UPI00069990DB|nr:aspartyl/asparaginyl beta-hydroxylase domain-containing protein [Streptomonospora alba]